MFPNAELALMFIPVQLRQNISTSLVLVDLYLGVSGQSILVGRYHILLTLEVLYLAF
jgi:hypothetical protein